MGVQESDSRTIVFPIDNSLSIDRNKATATGWFVSSCADEMAEQLSSVKVMIAVVKSAGPSLHTPVAQVSLATRKEL